MLKTSIEKPDMTAFMEVSIMGKIQDIFQECYPKYEKTKPVAAHAMKAAWKISNCRTKKLGGHIQKCPDDHYMQIWYNSCKHRSCPQCSGIQKEEWLHKQSEKLLDTGHFHVVFTIDHNINYLWLKNPKILTGVLFEAAKEALFGMLENEEKFMGVTPGMIATLQTWGETLIFHSHLHCLVTAGGITKDKKWRSEKKGYLLPAKKLSRVFRGKFIDKLHNLIYKGKLKRPEGMSYSELHRMLRRSRKKKWAVNICEKYPYGEGVVKYLARYIKGGPISEKRIKYWNKKEVKFIYKDNKNGGKKETIKLPTDEFIRRYLLHVPKPNLHVVRYYGLYASCKKTELNKMKAELGQKVGEADIDISWQEYCEQVGEKTGDDQYTSKCPVCGKELIIMGRRITAEELESVKNKFIIKGAKMSA